VYETRTRKSLEEEMKMKNRIRILALVSASILGFALTACSDKGGSAAQTAAAAQGLPAMDTTTQITLTYALWDDYEMTRALADKFTQKYPNIKIELIELPLDGYMDALLAQASTGDFPDMYQFLSLSTTVANGWLLDITEFWENDPDTANYYSSLLPSSYVDGKRVFRFAAEYLPHVTYVDRSVFNRLNEPMPAFNWTYEQAMDLAKKMTRPDQGVFGFNYMGGAGPVTLAPIALTDGLSEFGWDGEN
jgi:multiple sugar transport system substrate-binding protein